MPKNFDLPEKSGKRRQRVRKEGNQRGGGFQGRALFENRPRGPTAHDPLVGWGVACGGSIEVVGADGAGCYVGAGWHAPVEGDWGGTWEKAELRCCRLLRIPHSRGNTFHLFHQLGPF